MSESTDWWDHHNGMTVADRLSAMAKAGYDVTGPMGEIARVCDAAARRERRIAELEGARMKAALERIAANWDCIDNDENAIFNLPKGFMEAWQEAAQIAREGLEGKQ